MHVCVYIRVYICVYMWCTCICVHVYMYVCVACVAGAQPTRSHDCSAKTLADLKPDTRDDSEIQTSSCSVDPEPRHFILVFVFVLLFFVISEYLLLCYYSFIVVSKCLIYWFIILVQFIIINCHECLLYLFILICAI